MSSSPTMVNNDRSQTMSVYTERVPSETIKDHKPRSMIKNYDMLNSKSLI